MASLLLGLLLCVFVFLHGTCSIQLTSGPADGATMYICVGSNLRLDWTYTLSAGDTVLYVKWLYDARSQEMIAIYTNKVLSPIPAYSQRVERVGNGGLQISEVKSSDSGNYTVEVAGTNGNGASVTVRRVVNVVVSDGLLTRDGSLHVTQSAAAVLDADGHLALELTCGHFNFKDSPPADVQWRSPSGQLMSSANYADGHFALHLATPNITYGRYTCRVTSQSPNSCAHKDHEASVGVDVTAARLTLLEARLAYSEAQLSDTKTQLSNANQRIGSLENRASKTVSFHARSLVTYQQQLHSPIIVRDVLTNIGNGYNNRTGIFTAPISGVYFVVGATGPYNGGDSAGMNLMVDGQDIAFSMAYDQKRTEQTSVHGVVHLTAGQTVWMRASPFTAYYDSSATTFSGFLVTPDP